MPDLLYFIWALLPLALLVMTLHTATKAVLKTGKRDYPKNYFRELIFTTVMLGLSIFFDKTMLSPDSSLRLFIESFGIDYRLVRWLTYPALVTALAMIQQRFIDKKNKTENAEKVARRMKYAPK